MGFSAQVQSPQSSQSSGKGSPSQIAQPQQGQQGAVTYSSTSGQQQMGSPNPYPNTIGQWDNASIQPSRRIGGKGKGF